MQENEAFITIKDCKEGFPHHASCRLLNLSKTNIGRISKVLLDKINSAVQRKRMASQMNLNIYQMTYNNLKITREGNIKERLFGLTYPIQKT